MSLVQERRKKQLRFLSSGKEIEVGSLSACPFDIEVLNNIDAQSRYVSQVYSSGLTAVVYKISDGNGYYNLKKKREKILVQNPDGQTSFLNEVQRRRDFYQLKQQSPEKFKNIVNTLYASLKHGIILSEWIEGQAISRFSRKNFSSIFRTIFEVEKCGLFECDMSSSNLLVDENDEVHFFDFGYMYPYNSLIHFNSDGIENPVFHSAERFESRSFMQFLIDMEKTDSNSVIRFFETEKQEALHIYIEKLVWLEANKALPSIILWQRKHIENWENGLKSDEMLKNLLDMEMFRSLIMDILDDLSGKSCTQSTLIKAAKLLEITNYNYDFIKRNNGFYGKDQNLTKNQLLQKYNRMKEEIGCYLIR